MEEVIKKIISNKFFSFISFLLFFILTSIECIYINNLINEKITELNISKSEETIIEKVENDEVENIEYIYVDIKGSIKEPGVYKINKGSIVNDVINLSGGLTKDANTRFINLSKRLNDGDAIVIYSNKEINDAMKSNQIIVETPCVCEKVKNDVCIEENINNDKININTASLEELMSLSGIGESKAKSIIEYRDNNGGFKTIDELTKVSGISETIFSKIKENITV